mgnify:CR=1 FL=1
MYGLVDESRFAQRVPTVALTVAGWTSTAVASALGKQGIFCWHGDYYAVDVCRVLGQSAEGMVRLGILHINTMEEIERTLAAIAALA